MACSANTQTAGIAISQTKRRESPAPTGTRYMEKKGENEQKNEEGSLEKQAKNT